MTRTARAHAELEVKARVEDPEALRAALRAGGARLEFQGLMLDRRYDRKGALAKADGLLRVRRFQAADGSPARGEIAWKGPKARQGAYRRRPEIELAVSDPDAAEALFQRLGFRVSRAIDRAVEVYRLGDAVVRLERYPAMDPLLEVEGPPPAIEAAIAATGIPRGEFRPEALPEFVRRFERRTGRRAVLVGKVRA